MKLLASTFVAALVTSLIVTPIVRKLAIRMDILDHPDQHRKLHARATPLGGGVAVLISLFFAVILAMVFSRSQRKELFHDQPFLVGGALAAVVICGVGLLDDRFKLRGRQKLMGQFLAVGIVLASGLIIKRIQVFDYSFDLGLLAIPFTLFWLLGAINALNLLDGVDGLATSVGIVLSAAIGTLAMVSSHPTEAFMAFGLAGALAGFLFYNRPPASIFLGDAGSMLIGLVLGMLALRGSLKGPATVALAAPTAIWAIPILDVSMAILRRKLTGRSIYSTDRGHLHHRVIQRGITGWYTVLLIGLLCVATCVGAVISVYMHHEELALGTVAVIVAMLVVTRVFGHHECALLERHLRQFLRTLSPFARNKGREHGQLQARVRGTRQWEELWETLTAFAERFDLSTVNLNISLPAANEEYHASWKRKTPPTEAEAWYTEIPLLIRHMSAGRLSISGVCHGESTCLWMGDLIEGLKPFEMQMVELLSDHLDEVRTPPAPHGKVTAPLLDVSSEG